MSEKAAGLSLEQLIQALKEFEQNFENSVREMSDETSLEAVRVGFFGKKSQLSSYLRHVGQLPGDQKKEFGQILNALNARMQERFTAEEAKLSSVLKEKKLASQRIDVTRPGFSKPIGAVHPVTQTTEKVLSILMRLGFDVMTGPEVETDYMNFEAANTPEDHPARDMQDTFYLGTGTLLRTQTTAVQARAMRNGFPLRILCPGAVYRNDYDATHSPMFHQMEGLWIDRNVSFAHLKGVLSYFAKELFGAQTKIRLRPSYFPFVEPGAEVDVSCFKCGGKDAGCKVCKGTGWLEILGAGMVHPKLIQNAFDSPTFKVTDTNAQNLQPKDWTGFAFGLGLDRIAMILHEIPDLRLLFQGDYRFLNQF